MSFKVIDYYFMFFFLQKNTLTIKHVHRCMIKLSKDKLLLDQIVMCENKINLSVVFFEHNRCYYQICKIEISHLKLELSPNFQKELALNSSHHIKKIRF